MKALFFPFVKSIQDIIKEMSDISIQATSTFKDEEGDFSSQGVASIISFTGKLKGRLVIDMQPQLALKIVSNILEEEYTDVKDYMFLSTVSEVNNTIAGDGNTVLNNRHSYNLRLNPPVVFSGKDAMIALPKIPSASIQFSSEYGKLTLNVAFENEI